MTRPPSLTPSMFWGEHRKCRKEHEYFMSFHIEIGLTLFPSFMFVLNFKVARGKREGDKEKERERAKRQQAYFKRKGE